MSKIKQYKEVLILTIAEILAIIYDSFFYELQKEAATWFRSYFYFGVRFLPLFIIGFLIIFTLYSVNKKRLLFAFTFYFIIDILLLCINRFFFLFYDFIGISFILGVNLGGVIYMIILLLKNKNFIKEKEKIENDCTGKN